MQSYFQFINRSLPISKSNLTIATLFSGGGILEAGAAAAGIRPVWGVEKNAAIAHTHIQNFPECRTIVRDVRQVDFRTLEKPTIIHASPPCQSYSQASTGSETSEDIELAVAVNRCIERIQPRFFTLENVPSYLNSEAFIQIQNELIGSGYWLSYSVVDLANWGVPSHRKRLIVIASHNSIPPLLPPTRPTTSWWEAIADLYIDFPTSKLSPTQLKYLPAQAQDKHLILVKRNQIRKYTCFAPSDRPCWTITANLCTDGKGASRKQFADVYSTDECRSLSIEALARLQSIPKWYKLPNSNHIAGLIIGNGVPSYFAYQLYHVISQKILLDCSYIEHKINV